MDHSVRTRLSRRTLVGAAGLSAAGLSGVHRARAQATPPGVPADPTQIVLPPLQVTLPEGDVTFRWLDSGDNKALFFRAYFDAFTAAHPSVSFDYQGLPWTEIGEIVPLGVRNGNAPDVFQVPQGMPVAEAVREGWVRPIDDVIPNFDAWKATFPEGSFTEGVHAFNGRVYTFPRSTSKRGVQMTFTNRQLVGDAGFDPDNQVWTFDTFRECARKVTENAGGSAYGIIFGGQQTGRWGEYVRNLGRLSGSSAGPDDIDYRTGDFAYTSDGYIAAIEFLLALRDDGSVFPGVLSLNDPQSRAQFAEGVSGLILEGEFSAALWAKENPDFDFGVTAQPFMGESFTPVTYANTAGNHQWLFADSKYPEIAGELFSYIGSQAGQLAFVSITGGSDPSIYPYANDNAPIDERVRKCYDIFDERMRVGPDVRVRNPAASTVALNQTAPAPNFGEVIQGIFSGQLTDIRAAMQDLQDRSNASLDEAIAKAQAAGATVSRDDYIFPNWDPNLDYTQADYAALA